MLYPLSTPKWFRLCGINFALLQSRVSCVFHNPLVFLVTLVENHLSGSYKRNSGVTEVRTEIEEAGSSP